jgi:hypothetical protein
LSVRKVVPELTIRCVEIGLSMAGAKQQWGTRFIPVPVVGRTSSRGALVALYLQGTVVLVEGGYKRGGRGGEASKSLRTD